ncbi:MAG: DUF885 domain-containing protein [Thermoanaerobaculia bacterium]|nr:MAG: DUF885 domain-containing protein [Thermoanaerobaculia bacterium]MBZ0100636.1 DUF885 domain-containing protein [Thermoanaerobaculia bacterium]
MRMRNTVVLGLVLLAAGPMAAEESAAARFATLIEREWAWRLAEFPTLATAVGVHDFDDRLEDASLAAYARRDGETAAFLAELAGIDRAALGEADRVDFDIFRRQLVERRETFHFGEHLLPLNADSGFHTSFALLHRSCPFATPRDFENYLARLEAFPAWLDQHVERMREGVRRGLTIPRATLDGIETTIEPLAAGSPDEHAVFAPFTRLPATFPAATREVLRERAREVVAEQVIPAYARFLAFMSGEYVPACRTSIAATALPDGEAWYDFLVRNFTTVEMSPRQIHQLGLDEMARLRGEMEAAMRDAGFAGDFGEFLAFLRTDPRFYAKTPEELLREASWIAKRADAALPRLFGRLPRQPYGVMAVPQELAPKYTSGRYAGSPRESTEPGWYWVNTHALDKRPLYNLEALTLHEAVPGHHLQGALAEEADEVRPFRRFDYISAFGEGWGLYAEYLGNEAGFYRDPYSRFGYLGYQAWRAARLVVDTGLHAFGWSRRQAIDYLAANTSLPLVEATSEVDRYISWPGQALSYYVGYLKIRELRQRAEAALGESFDLRAFHDELLRHGSVPLPVLESIVDAWIAAATPATP